MTWIKHKKSLIMYVGALFFLLVLLLVFAHRNTMNERAFYFDNKNAAFGVQIDATIDRYQVFSEYVYGQLIDEVVLNIMHIATHGTETEKAHARTVLYDYLIDDYETIIEYDFRQLHFHTVTGDSFLRFHAPETYGDNLFDIRNSIYVANTEGIKVSGFEEGRVYNGYRFLYPLFYQDEPVGSVEISISIATAINTLYSVYDDKDVFFFIEKDVVERLVFDEYLDNYQVTALSSNYYYDTVVNQATPPRRHEKDLGGIGDFFTSINHIVCDQMLGKQDFSIIVRQNATHYGLHFNSLYNISGEHVGYLMVLEEDLEYANFINNHRVTVVAMSFFFLILSVGGVYYLNTRMIYKVQSRIDPLTQTYNRRYFMQILNKAFDQYHKSNQPFALMILDLDHFKTMNDTHGHAYGDRVLIAVAQTIQSLVSDVGTVARWGGEEFVVLLENTSVEAARNLAETMRAQIVTLHDQDNTTLTASIGVTSVDTTDDLDTLIQRADTYLYQAKAKGRNCVI